MFQSYAVYGAPSIDLNRRHLQSDRAASTLVFDLQTIDNRFPALDEGQLWPDLIAHYDPAGTANGRLLLRRHAAPRDVELHVVDETRVPWSQPVTVPADPAPIWTTIQIDKTMYGRVLNVLYKAPPIGVWLNARQRTAAAPSPRSRSDALRLRVEPNRGHAPAVRAVDPG
jgi:hypothetical protein